MKQLPRSLAVSVISAVTYAAAVVLGRATRLAGSETALVWPAAAVAVIWLLVARRHGRYAYTVHAIALGGVTFAVNLATGAAPPIAAWFGMINVVLGAVTVAILTARHTNPLLRDPGDMARLTVAVTFGCGCAAVVATAVLTELTGAPVAQNLCRVRRAQRCVGVDRGVGVAAASRHRRVGTRAVLRQSNS